MRRSILPNKFTAFLSAFLLLILPLSGSALTKEEIREAWTLLGQKPDQVYAVEPCLTSPYSAGTLTEDALNDALRYFNFLRSIAGLKSVGSNDEYTTMSQYAACLTSSAGTVSHVPAQPSDMDDEFFSIARTGCSRGNIASFNWSANNLLRSGIMYMIRDDGEDNLSTLAHRRWCLSPLMSDTGFGYAGNGENTIFVMYAVDENSAADISYVAWPSSGDFPADLLSNETAWSLTFPRDEVAFSDELSLVLTEETSGQVFTFDFKGESDDGYSTACLDDTGWGPSLIFKPDIVCRGILQYEQNQKWTVTLNGVTDKDGIPYLTNYTVSMMSLWPIPVSNIELSEYAVALRPGESATITAHIIPSYADETVLTYSSSSDRVASVDQDGTVHAHSCGTCSITVSAGGKSRQLSVTVDE